MRHQAILEVDLTLLKKNYKTLKSLSENSFFCPMVKDEAYGHGIVPVSQALFEAGVQQIGVLDIHEACSVREKTKIKEIIIFGPCLNKESLSWILNNKVTLVCSNWFDLKKLAQIKKPSRIHLKFDTGFSRLGFGIDEAQGIYDFLKDQAHIQLEALATQLVSGEDIGDENSFSYYQIKKIIEINKLFSCQNIHLLNTSALLASFVNESSKNFGVRPGIGLYGIKPPVFFKDERAKKKWEDLSLDCVSSLKSYIVSVQKLKKGELVSYGGTWKASKPSQIATVFLGYGDGFLRSSDSVREVLFRGRRRAIVGTVCMDFLMIDVTDCDREKPVEIGEEVVLFGQQKEAFLCPQAQAECSGSISYELFSRLGHRVERVYKS